MKPANILEEAIEVVRDRQARYGPPWEHWTLTTRLINARFGTAFKAEDWGTIMILEKIAREAHTTHRDNDVDAAGYANGRRLVIERSNGNGHDAIPTSAKTGEA